MTGTLTKAELIAGLKADFDRLDTNHNGCLTADQAAAINGRAHRRRSVHRHAACRTGTRMVASTCANFPPAAYSLFDQLDKNGDGKISPQEFDPTKKPGAGAAPAQPQAQTRGRRGNGGAPPGGSGPPP